MIQDFWVFALTGLLLNLTPGNDMLFVIARSSSGGTRSGVISALGIGAGCLVHIFAAMLGLSALIAQSALAFTVIKYLGAAYLVYLGLSALVKRKNQMEIKNVPRTNQNVFWQGVFTNVLNPKVAFFFLAFLPQFISVGSTNTSLQILFLGVWFDVVGTVVNILVAILFGSIGGWLSRSTQFVQWQQRVTGIILIGLGIRLGLTSRK
jgi:threonine/homoserine/homoserine lactone efflux protein